MSKAIRFSLYVDNPERAIKFYSEALGWKMNKARQEGHWFINAGPKEEEGLEGDMEQREGSRTTVAHFRVKSYKDTVKAALKNGGKVLKETDMGEMGKHAFLQDSEGNVIGIMEEGSFKPGGPGGPGGPGTGPR